MKDYFQAEVKEDCIIFTLNETARITPSHEFRHDLEAYIDHLKNIEQNESDLRVVEIESAHEEFARLLLEHMKAGKDLPPHKSYSLNM